MIYYNQKTNRFNAIGIGEEVKPAIAADMEKRIGEAISYNGLSSLERSYYLAAADLGQDLPFYEEDGGADDIA